MTLEEKYPFIASWVVDGEIHIGRAERFILEPLMQRLFLWETSQRLEALKMYCGRIASTGE